MREKAPPPAVLAQSIVPGAESCDQLTEAMVQLEGRALWGVTGVKINEVNKVN